MVKGSDAEAGVNASAVASFGGEVLGADMGNDEMTPIGPWAIRLGPKLKRCLVASLLIVLSLAAVQTLMAVLAALGAFS